ncbi:hypothetical protein K469DRAFT_604466 [Zopfia rhizophila CBS 207.26]|uniref:Tse2 ADP-ribosyltransferase toxin domain-containing protein n=1 Tax=Zopfia rhizophila CBS 207.26 TaxID=1314779 RepID=A0A6A6DFB2_9PEZI|nr:hypothetical protein K469DRAFT_604466 [Zopfia rhizophila CBS 207.26]
MSSTLITVFKHIPKELFRVNNGRAIILREWSLQRQRSFDIVTKSGKVKAKALDPATYRGKFKLTLNVTPNGASMRPISAFQRNLVQSFRGQSVVVYSVPAGTPLPEDLILVHEHTDHYSLQAAEGMSLTGKLNGKITSFLESYGTAMSKEEWLQAYPQPTGPASSSNEP